LLSVVRKMPSATTVFAKAFGQAPQPKPGYGECSAVGSGGPPRRGVVRESPATGADVTST